MKNLSLVFLLSIVLMATGCGPATPVGEQPDPLAVRLQALESKHAESERGMAEKLDHLERQVTDSAAKARRDTRDLEMRMGSAIAKLERVEAVVQSLQTEFRHFQAHRPPAAIEEPVPPEPAITTVPAPGPAAEMFPVRVYDVLGITVITGSQPGTREVETDETYRDEFGQRVKRRVTEPVEVNEYGYRVRFSMQNLTDQPVGVAAGAGRASQTFLLPPQELIEEATIEWTPGSALTVIAGGQRKRHPIPWE